MKCEQGYKLQIRNKTQLIREMCPYNLRDGGSLGATRDVETSSNDKCASGSVGECECGGGFTDDFGDFADKLAFNCVS